MADSVVARRRRQEHAVAAQATGQADVVTDRLQLASEIIWIVEQRLAVGEILPDVRDGLAATQILARYQEAAPEPKRT